MAKGYLEKRLKELKKTGIEVSSAGIAPVPGMRATEEAKQIIIEEGGDISEHVARNVTELEIRQVDVIFVMENRHKEYIIGRYPEAATKVYLLKDFERLGNLKTSDDPDIRDPIGKDINFYKEAFSIIKNSIERILKEI